MKKIVIFDLDGTLFDTTYAMQACGNHALSLLSLPGFSREDYARFSGGGVEEYVGAILESAGDKEHRHFDVFWRSYLEKNASLPDNFNQPYPGVVSLLSMLIEKGICLAVLSNKDHASCVQIVEKAFGKEVFSVIRGEKGDIPVKPDPAGVFAILEETGFSPEQALYVGDTEVDMITGKRAGVETCGALWGYRTREILEREGADILLETPLDLLSIC